jgi:hypothetical protein
MITNLDEIEYSALSLDRISQARLVDKLLKSVHGKIDSEIQQAWIKEVQKRKEALDSGEASLHPAAEVMKEARKFIRR